MTFDLPPKIPAIIRPIEHKLFNPHYLPANKEQRKSALRELIARGEITKEQAKLALVFLCPPGMVGAGAAGITFVSDHSNVDTANATSYTDRQMTLTGSWTSVMLVFCARGTAGGRTLSSVSINKTNGDPSPTAPTFLRRHSNGFQFVEIWSAAISSFYSVDTTWSGAMENQTVVGATFTGMIDPTTALETKGVTTNGGSMAFSANAGDLIISGGMNANGSTCTWSLGGELFDAVPESGRNATAAYHIVPSTGTVDQNATFSSFNTGAACGVRLR